MTTHTEPKAKSPSAARRFGYLVAVVVNVFLLYVVNNLGRFEVVGFLTDDFGRVVPLINVALVLTIIVNIAYLFHDRPTFKSLTQLGILGINMVVSVRLFQVFPFDFLPYDFNWATVTRAILIISMVGIVVAGIVELAKLGRSLAAS